MKRAFIIAEAGVNHEGDLATALTMVREAAEAGCDAIKFQSYRASDLVTADAPTYWQDGRGSQRDAFSQVPSFTEDEWRRLSQECREWVIEFIVTPFHVEDVGFFGELCDRLKVASGDITNKPLLEAVASAGLPVLLSTGAATLREVGAAFTRFRGDQVTLLHCVLSYPTATSAANIARLIKLGGISSQLGYSDHTVPPDSHRIIQAANVLGAAVIEKHFTLDKTLPGNDHYHSFDPKDFRRLRANLDMLAEACEYRGEVQPCEEAGRVGARRSWTSRVDIPAGTTITEEMVMLMRPGNGLQP